VQIHDLASAYRSKTDEELLQLAMDSGQLTVEAHAALTGELAARRIDFNEYLRTRGDSLPIGQRTCSAPFFRDSHTVGDFVTEVVRLYHRQFWLFFKLTVPAVLLGYIAVVTVRNEVRGILRHLPQGIEALGHHAQILEIWLANLAAGLISWIAFCFSFGAICSALRQIEAGTFPSVPDSFTAIRARMGAFFTPCAATLFLVFSCRGSFGAAFLECFLGITSLAASPEQCHHSVRGSCVHGLSAARLIPLWACETGADLGRL
jgi:hypothetical protein